MAFDRRYRSSPARLRVAALAPVLLAGMASAALAVAPRGNANYVAVDHQGRPAITLWMKTKTNMIVFVCYDWRHGPNEGNHFNNDKRITVTSRGSFSYDGPASDLNGRHATIKLSGHFVSKDKATGMITAPCLKHHRFTAHYAPH
jgi:hypothetical protein